MQLDLMLKFFLRTRELGIMGATKRCRERTLQNYAQDLTHFVKFLETKGLKEYAKVTRLEVMDFVHDIDHREWADASKLKVFRSMRAFFRWIELDEDCAEEGLKSFRKFLPKIGKTKPRSFIPILAQLKAFKKAFDLSTRSGFRNYVAFCLMLDTGMRIGELRHLKMEQVNLVQGFLTVPNEGKTGMRVVRLTIELQRLLARWLKRRSEFAKCDLVFVSDEGTPCSRWMFNTAFRRLAEEHKLANITPHTLRHVYCTYYLKGGGDLAKLSTVTGHTSLETLQGYLHLAEIAGTEIAAEMERVSPLKQVNQT